MVAIEDARQILMEQYGASFDEEWRMNEPPIFDFCGIPYDPDYWSMTVNDADLDNIDDSDNELVCDFFLMKKCRPILKSKMNNSHLFLFASPIRTTKIRQNTHSNPLQSVPIGSVFPFWHMP